MHGSGGVRHRRCAAGAAQLSNCRAGTPFLTRLRSS
jgi:hypothetical protein